MTSTLDMVPAHTGSPRSATAASLRPFFRPSSIAVIGASRHPDGIGSRLLHSIIQNGFHGKVYPVNPHAAAIAGLQAYPNLRAIPGAVDLAIIATPPESVLGIIDDCAAREVPAVLVITAGFAEVGAKGAVLQQHLLDKVRAAGCRLIGPNCLGLINTDTSLNATFVPIFPPRGCVAMSSDSGALGLALLSTAARLGVGISSCVSVGNRADVSSNDLLEYWESDDATELIVLYLESFGNPRRFARIARRVSRRKPIVAVKAGRTGAGSRAAGSHTAALAARDVAVDALFRQTGILRVDTLQELLEVTAALSMQPLPRGRRVGILTNAGGPAILCADSCEAGGLVIPELSEQTRRELSGFLPPSASLGNPVDMIASATPEQFRRAIQVMLRSSEVDALIVLYICVDESLTRPVQEAVQATVAELRPSVCDVPVLSCVMAGDNSPAWLDAGSERLPCYAFPEAPARALSKMTAYAEWRRRDPGQVPTFDDMDVRRMQAICRQVLDTRGSDWLSVQEARELLQMTGLKTVPGGVARSADEAVDLACRVGFPVAVKLAARGILHKTERGGVRLGLKDEAAVRRAFADIRDRLSQEGDLDAMEGVLVQPMVTGGTEVLVGVTHDPVFGPLVAFGLGGIHVEILGDVCFRVAPLTDRDASDMVRSIRGYRLFEGYRGHPPADIPALEELLLRISRLVEEVPEVVELDLNPVFALACGKGYQIADVRIRVERMK